jgi:cytoskeleton protein RodZ
MSEVDMKTSELGKSTAAAPALSPQAPAAGRTKPTTGDDNASFGRALAAAREARGLSQSDVAAQLRLHLRQVRAIEAEDLEALPEGPFVRGYVRNYAKLVDLAAEPLLALLNGRLKPTDPLHSQADSRAVSPIQRTPGEPWSGRIVIAGIMLALAVLAAFGWWSMRADGAKPAAVPPQAPVAPPAQSAPPSSPPAAAVEPSGNPASADAAAPAAPIAAVVPAEAIPAPIGALLRMNFRDRSWVEIRQSDGTVLMSQNNAPGSTKMVEGTPPFLVVIGNASKVDLEFRGQAVDLAAFVGRDDIAKLRLE